MTLSRAKASTPGPPSARVRPHSTRKCCSRLLDAVFDEVDGNDPAVALAEDAHPGRVLQVAVPDHDEAQGVRPHVRGRLSRGRVGIHEELRALGAAGGEVALAEHAGTGPPAVAAAAPVIALPCDHEVAGGIGAHRWKALDV